MITYNSSRYIRRILWKKVVNTTFWKKICAKRTYIPQLCDVHELERSESEVDKHNEGNRELLCKIEFGLKFFM